MRYPFVSIIIPTHNRSTLLLQNLYQLASQRYPLENLEVIVVADGCDDHTAGLIRDCSFPFSIKVIEQELQGPAMARNHGAQFAIGDYLIFIDDDIAADQNLVTAHIDAQLKQANQVIIGYLPPILQVQTGYFREELRGWWESMFSVMLVPGYRYRYSNLLTGNFSIPAHLFKKVSGFDPQFYCHEDYELGWRLIKHGAAFKYVPEAWGYHHENTLLERTLLRKQAEGKADVLLARKHPELLPILQLSRLVNYGNKLWQFYYRFAFDQPMIGDRFSDFLLKWMNRLEDMQLYYRWRNVLEALLVFNYLKGVASMIPTRKEWLEFIEANQKPGGWQPTSVTVDLAQGISAAEKFLDQHKPDAVRFVYGSTILREEVAYPGVEPIRGEHLSVYLAYVLRDTYLKTVVRPELDTASQDDGFFKKLIDDHLSRIDPNENPI